MANMQDDDHTGSNSGLPRDIQEHLGRRLRTELHIEAEKPSFLGESTVPPQLESLVRKLEAGESTERQGYEAVKRALIGEDAPEPDGSATPLMPRRPHIPKRTD